jgi:hypothetical protein
MGIFLMFLENNTEMFWLFCFLLSTMVPVGAIIKHPKHKNWACGAGKYKTGYRK